MYDKNVRKLDGKYISPISCVPSEELYDKNKVEVIFRKVEQNATGVDAYNENGNKLKGVYKKVEDDGLERKSMIKMELNNMKNIKMLKMTH